MTKWIGIISIVLALFSILPSLVGGFGVAIALFILIISGISALDGEFKYVTIVISITSINIFGLSIASELWLNDSKEFFNFLKFVTMPYAITLIFIAIGFWRKTRK